MKLPNFPFEITPQQVRSSITKLVQLGFLDVIPDAGDRFPFRMNRAKLAEFTSAMQASQAGWNLLRSDEFGNCASQSRASEVD
jgi:hypothetical protein